MRIGLALPAMLDGVDRPLLLSWARRIEADGYATIGFGERISYRNLEAFTVPQRRRGGHRTGRHRRLGRGAAHALRGVGGQADGDARRGLRRAGRARRRRGRAPGGLRRARPADRPSLGAARRPGRPHPPALGRRGARRPASTRWGRRPSTASRSCRPAPAPGRWPAARCGPTASTASSSTPAPARCATDAARTRAAWTAAGPDRAARGDDLVVVRARRRPGAPAARLRPPLPRRLRRATWPRRWPSRARPPVPTPCAPPSTRPPTRATTRSSSSPPSPTSPSSTP